MLLSDNASIKHLRFEQLVKEVKRGATPSDLRGAGVVENCDALRTAGPEWDGEVGIAEGVRKFVGIISRVEVVRDEDVEVQAANPLRLGKARDGRNVLASPCLGASAGNGLG